MGRCTIRAAGVAALTALAARSAGEPATPVPSGVLEFPLPDVEPREHFRVEIPQELQEAAHAHGDVLVPAVDIHGREQEDANCAMELAVDYAHGSKGAWRLAEPAPSVAEAEAALERHYERFLESFDVETAEEFDKKYANEIPVSGTGYEEHLHELWSEGNYETWAQVRRDYFAEVAAEYEQEAKEAARSSEIENVGRNLGFHSPQPLTEYNGSSPETGTYISGDYQTITVVQNRAYLPSGSGEDYPDFEARTVKFPLDAQDREGTSELATLEITAISGEKVAVVGGETREWSQDPSGTWQSEGR